MKRPNIRRDTVRLLDLAVRNGGHTIHLPGHSGGRYIVGGLTTPLHVPPHQATHPVTIGYISQRIEALLADFPRAETLGSWLDVDATASGEGTIHIDLGTTHDSRDTALHLARLRGERAIYDTHTDESIYL